MRLFAVLLGLFFLAPQAVDLVDASQSISTAEISAHIKFLSDDMLGGRAIGSRGGAIAEEYVEAMFRQYGLEPAFADGYMQKVVLRKVTPDEQQTMSLIAPDGETIDPEYRTEFVAACPFPAERHQIEADLVYVGYGIVSERWNWDDYKDVDVAGKVLVMHVNEPRPDLDELFEGKALTYNGRWRYKYQEAARHGALGALLIHSDEDAGYTWTVVKNSWSGSAGFFDPEAPNTLPLQSWINGETAEALITKAGFKLADLRAQAQSPDFRPVPLNMKISYSAANKYEEVITNNVVGVARGKAPAESAKGIVVSAHHDHLGIGNAEDGDNIYNGAIDNCAASASMLATARFFGAHQGVLDCDVYFLSCAAEEEGLLGSDYFARNMPVANSRVLANINYEMTNVWGEAEDILCIGAEHSQLYDLIGMVGARHDMTIMPDSVPEQGYFFRSDQFSFANQGIPAVWFDLGETLKGKPEGTGAKIRADFRANCYHRPADEFDPSWELTGTVQICRLAVELITEIDKAGDVKWKETSPFSTIDRK